MQSLQKIKSQIESTEDLHSVVTTMKTLAAVSIRQYENALESIKQYDKTIELGFEVLLNKQKSIVNIFPDREKNKAGIIIIGSEQGMSGRFNETIVDYAKSNMAELEIDTEDKKVIALGSKVSGILNSSDIKINSAYSLPSSVKNIPNTIQKILSGIEHWRNSESVGEIYFFYNRKLSSSDFEAVHKQLFPISRKYLESLVQEKWSSNCIPQIKIEEEKFFSALIREYLFVSIYRGIIESLAGENASRLASMQAAENNIEERENELEAQYNHLRQSAITSELLDIVGGTLAIN